MDHNGDKMNQSLPDYLKKFNEQCEIDRKQREAKWDAELKKDKKDLKLFVLKGMATLTAAAIVFSICVSYTIYILFQYFGAK